MIYLVAQLADKYSQLYHHVAKEYVFVQSTLGPLALKAINDRSNLCPQLYLLCVSLSEFRRPFPLIDSMEDLYFLYGIEQ